MTATSKGAWNVLTEYYLLSSRITVSSIQEPSQQSHKPSRCGIAAPPVCESLMPGPKPTGDTWREHSAHAESFIIILRYPNCVHGAVVYLEKQQAASPRLTCRMWLGAT